MEGAELNYSQRTAPIYYFAIKQCTRFKCWQQFKRSVDSMFSAVAMAIEGLHADWWELLHAGFPRCFDCVVNLQGNVKMLSALSGATWAIRSLRMSLMNFSLEIRFTSILFRRLDGTFWIEEFENFSDWVSEVDAKCLNSAFRLRTNN